MLQIGPTSYCGPTAPAGRSGVPAPASQKPPISDPRGTDVVVVSNDAASSSLSEIRPDDAAAAVAAVVSSLKGLADDLNSTRQFLDPEVIQTMRHALGDVGAEKWLARIKQHISDTEKDLADLTSYAAQSLGASGGLPAKSEDGTWHYGSFSVSLPGRGFVTRADSRGGVQIAKGGKPFVAWTQPASTGVGNAQIALQTLKHINNAV